MAAHNPNFGEGKMKKKVPPSASAKTRRKAPVQGTLIAAAWKAWIGSEEGRDCARFATLGAAAHPEPYLYNRLWRAFMAGAKRPRSRKAKGPQK